MPHPSAGPLDPDARVVIDRLNALNAPGYEAMPPKAARAIAAHLRRNAPYPQVKVAAVRDFQLATSAGPLRLRHYHPFVLVRAAPTLMAASATLKAGKWRVARWKSRKSTT